jgi:hypothetical protein
MMKLSLDCSSFRVFGGNLKKLAAVALTDYSAGGCVVGTVLLFCWCHVGIIMKTLPGMDGKT